MGGQDPVSSHFYASPMQLNPAMAGAEGVPKLSIGYRNQWPAAGSPYVTYRAGYEQYIERFHSGIGLSVVNDVQGGGSYTAMSIDLIYAYHFRLSRNLSLSGGLQASWGQRLLRTDNLVLPDMIDPATGTIGAGSELLAGQLTIYPDFASGISGSWKDFYGGISMHHLTRPSISSGGEEYARLPRKLTVHAGTFIPIYEKRLGKEILQLSPNIIYIQQLDIIQLNYGLEVLYRSMFAGIWGRNDLGLAYGTLIFSTGFKSSNYRFRYSYDIKLSSPSIKIPDLGAHELSLIIIFDTVNKNRHRAIKCPKI